MNAASMGRGRGRLPKGTCALLCAWALRSMAQAPSPTSPDISQLLSDAAKTAEKAAELAKNSETAEAATCKRAGDLDQKLREVAAKAPPTGESSAVQSLEHVVMSQAAADAAAQGRRSCVAAAATKVAAKLVDRDAQQLLRRMALLASACSLDLQKPCAARLMVTELQDLRSRVAAAESRAQASIDTKGVTERAGGAQAKVAELKAAQDGAFKHGDTAASAALKWLAANPSAPMEERRRVAQAAADSLRASIEVNRTGREAQRVANDLVRATLDLAQCESGAILCPGERYRVDLEAVAVEADTRLTALIKDGTDAAKTAKEKRWESEVRDLRPDARDRAIRFLRLLDENDDAKALAGTDAARITASTAGSQATLRLNFDTPSGWSRNRYNLAFSAPLSESESRSSVFSRAADKLETRPHVRFSWNQLLQPSDTSWIFAAWGLTAAAGREEVSYVDPDDLRKSKIQRSSPTSLGLTLLLSPAKDGQLHDLRIERQRAVDDAPSKITCPVPAAGSTTPTSCLQGRVGMPTQSWSTVSSYEYRRQRSGFDFAVKLTYDREQRLADVVVPFYLFKSGDEDDKGKRNAGLSIAWGNKDRGTTIAVFVGAPFALRAK